MSFKLMVMRFARKRGRWYSRGLASTSKLWRKLWKTDGISTRPVAVPQGSAKSQRLVLDMSRRSTYVEINRIFTFLDYHESAEVTHEELKEPSYMERALVRQWRYEGRTQMT